MSLEELLMMKGTGRVLMTLLTKSGAYSVFTYADGSIALKRDNATLGIWEAHEMDDCLRALTSAAPERPDGEPLTLMVVKGLNNHHRAVADESAGHASSN
jgi:hypothetical protein